MTASGQQDLSVHKAKLEFGVWRASFQRAYANWANAPHDLKNPLLLTGPSLARAESWLLALPNRLSNGEKRFIIRSIAQRSGSEAAQPGGRAFAGNPRTAQLQVGIQWLLFAVLGAAIWMLAPDIIQSGVRSSIYAMLDLVEPGVYRPREPAKQQSIASTSDNSAGDYSAGEPSESAGLPIDEPDYDLAGRTPLIAGIDMGKLERSARLQSVQHLVELSDSRLKAGDSRAGALLAVEAAKRIEAIASAAASSAAAIQTHPQQGDSDPATGTGAEAPPGNTVNAELPLLLDRAQANIRLALSRRTSVSSPLLTEFAAGPAAMFCPTGRIVLTVPAKDTVEAWNVTTRRRIMTLTDRRTLFRGASFDPACERLLLTGDDHVAEVFSLADGRRMTVLEGHEASVLATAWSKDGSTVLTAGQDTTARLWDIRTGRMLSLLQGHEDFVVAAAMSPDGRLALTASSDKTARIWSVRTGRPLQVLGQHRGKLTDAAFSPDGSRVLTTSWDGDARIWDTATGGLLHTFRSQGGSIMTARFDAAGSRLVTMTQRSLLQVWSMAGGQLITTIADDRDQFRTFDLDPRGDWLVTTSWRGNSRLWQLGDGRMIANLGGTNRRTQDVSISGDGGRASAMMSDGALENWPLFAGIDQAIGQARRQIGQCLSGLERDALGLPPEQPKWCRDNAG